MTRFFHGVRYGGPTEASAPTEGCKKYGEAGRRGRRPLRKRYKKRGASPGGRGRTPPLRRAWEFVRRATARVAPTEMFFRWEVWVL